jgi:hypothetical protein
MRLFVRKLVADDEDLEASAADHKRMAISKPCKINVTSMSHVGYD